MQYLTESVSAYATPNSSSLAPILKAAFVSYTRLAANMRMSKETLPYHYQVKFYN